MKMLILLFMLMTVLGAFLACSKSSSEPEEEEMTCNTPFNADDFPAATVSFQTDIQPIINDRCMAGVCHGAQPPQSNFSPGTALSILGPGDQAAARGTCNVLRGDPDNSYLMLKLTGAPGIDGQQMPVTGAPLDSVQIALIRQWILEGARDN